MFQNNDMLEKIDFIKLRLIADRIRKIDDLDSTELTKTEKDVVEIMFRNKYHSSFQDISEQRKKFA